MKRRWNAESVETASILNDEEVLQVILREVKKKRLGVRLLKAQEDKSWRKKKRKSW